MEKKSMMKKFDEHKVLELPSLTLAYMGDSVYELIVRNYLISKGIWKVKDLHKAAVKFVQAKAQARALHRIESFLNEKELAVVKRGRNAKSGTIPKNAEMIDYKHSTAFEALVGYLHFTKQQARTEEILGLVLSFLEQDEGD